MKKSKAKIYLLLHVVLMVYSLGGICSKIAAGQEFLSITFCVCYGILLMLMLVYALFWQQVIKALPLTVAFANKAVTVIWGLIWGVLFFKEEITIGKIIGVLLVVLGVVLYATEEAVGENE